MVGSIKTNTHKALKHPQSHFLPSFPVCCPDNPYTHAPIRGPGQEPAEYILVLFLMAGNPADL